MDVFEDIFMTYEEMKEKVYALQLDDLAHGIKVNELENII